MKILLLFVSGFFALNAHSEVFNCYSNAHAYSFKGKIILKNDQAFFRTWGEAGNNLGPFEAIRKGPAILIDFDKRNFRAAVVLMQKEGFPFNDYEYQFVASTDREDHCVKQ